MTILRPCRRCGRPRPPGRCPGCGWTKRRRDLTTRTHRHHANRLIAAHVQQHGYRCPGWPRTRGWHDAHPHDNPLTADHTTAHTHHPGTPADAVLCRACNSRKGATE